MPLASAVTIQYLSPLFTIFLAGFLMKESAQARQWLYFFLAFEGVVLVKGFDPRVSLFELSAGVLAAVFSAFAYNFVRELNDSDHPLVVVMYFPVVTLPLITPFVIAGWVTPSFADWPWVLAIGVFTQLAQVHMTHAYQLEKASRVAILNYVGLIFAVGIGYF